MNNKDCLKNNVIWCNLNEDGSIKGNFKNKAAVYIFRLESRDKPCYVGSSLKLVQRINTHKCRINN
jgi:hypothetical protein